MKASELLPLAVDWLTQVYPGSLIVSELSVADWGGARVDVAAITECEIVGVEIKGENADAFMGLDLVDRQGEQAQDGSRSGTMNGARVIRKYASEETLKDATLKLRFRDGGKKVDIPFHLSDVEVSKR